MKTIYFVRHGETDFNKAGIIQGSGVDSDLNETGKAQAAAFYEHYRNIPFGLLITSNLKRTHQTMQHFIDAGLNWEKDGRINEMNWGIHEGQPGTPAMKARYAAMIAQWKQLNFDARLENGESAAELHNRVAAFINDLKKRKEQNILVCSHGRTLRCISTVLKAEPLTEMEKYTHNNTGLFLAEYNNDSFQLILENDTMHLKNFVG